MVTGDVSGDVTGVAVLVVLPRVSSNVAFYFDSFSQIMHAKALDFPARRFVCLLVCLLVCVCLFV